MAKVATVTHNLKDFEAMLKRLDKGAKSELKRVMHAIALPLFERTQELVPVEKGDLKASGRISIRVGNKQLTLSIKYGNDQVLYAARQHEDLTLKHPNGGQAKYVESVVRGYPFLEVLAALIDLKGMLAGGPIGGFGEEAA
jgi:hypothetical protein